MCAHFAASGAEWPNKDVVQGISRLGAAALRTGPRTKPGDNSSSSPSAWRAALWSSFHHSRYADTQLTFTYVTDVVGEVRLIVGHQPSRAGLHGDRPNQAGRRERPAQRSP